MPPMELKSWRIAENLTLGAAAARLGLAGGARSFQRIEQGATGVDADLEERIMVMTTGKVATPDLHATRLAWLRQNRPEKFAEAAA
jgi:hypothetical protein